MANDFVNKVTLENGTTYDVQDARLVVTSADAGKVISVDENGNIVLKNKNNTCIVRFYPQGNMNSLLAVSGSKYNEFLSSYPEFDTSNPNYTNPQIGLLLTAFLITAQPVGTELVNAIAYSDSTPTNDFYDRAGSIASYTANYNQGTAFNQWPASASSYYHFSTKYDKYKVTGVDSDIKWKDPAPRHSFSQILSPAIPTNIYINSTSRNYLFDKPVNLTITYDDRRANTVYPYIQTQGIKYEFENYTATYTPSSGSPYVRTYTRTITKTGTITATDTGHPHRAIFASKKEVSISGCTFLKYYFDYQNSSSTSSSSGSQPYTGILFIETDGQITENEPVNFYEYEE